MNWRLEAQRAAAVRDPRGDVCMSCGTMLHHGADDERSLDCHKSWCWAMRAADQIGKVGSCPNQG